MTSIDVPKIPRASTNDSVEQAETSALSRRRFLTGASVAAAVAALPAWFFAALGKARAPPFDSLSELIYAGVSDGRSDFQGSYRNRRSVR